LGNSAESIYLSNHNPSKIEFSYGQNLNRAHVLYRLAAGGDQIGKYYPISMKVSKVSDPADPDYFPAQVTSDCIAFKR